MEKATHSLFVYLPIIHTSIYASSCASVRRTLSFIMALSNLGALILNLIIFITTLVNFSFALAHLEPLVLLALYALTKIFVTPPEDGIFSICRSHYLYET